MATHNIELVPFDIPTHVFFKMPPGLKQDGIGRVPSIRIEQMPRATIEQMCDEFRQAVLSAYEAGQPKGELREAALVGTGVVRR